MATRTSQFSCNIDRLAPTSNITAPEADCQMDGATLQLPKFGASEPAGNHTADENGIVHRDFERMDGEYTSHPPSPPDSGSSTPELRVEPCPDRLKPVVPAPNYGTVEVGQIYRSSYPQDRNLDFIKLLKIRGVLTLVSTEPPPGFQDWMNDNDIKHIKVSIAPNKEGNIATTTDSLSEALLHVLDGSNYPLYIHCNQGRHRTGCVVACLRKIQRVPLDQILTEYHAYAHPKARTGDIDLIKSFNPDDVYSYAKAHGYFDGAKPQLTRLDSWITNIASLAQALGSNVPSPASTSSADGREMRLAESYAAEYGRVGKLRFDEDDAKGMFAQPSYTHSEVDVIIEELEE